MSQKDDLSRLVEKSRQTAKAARLIVRNLSFSATEKHVRKTFGTLGNLVEVTLPTKSNAAESKGGPAHRGFAFVQYSDIAEAEKAISQLNGNKICGRGVAVDWAMDSKVYGNLLKEEERNQRQTSKKVEAAEIPANTNASERSAKKRPAKALDEDEDVEEDSEEDEDVADAKGEGSSDEDRDEDGNEENDEEDKTEDEVRRMKSLLGDEEATPDTGERDKVAQKAKQKTKNEKEERAPGFDVGEGRTLFVRNCPFDATQEEIRTVFSRFGKVGSVKFVADKSGQNAHSGSLFIKFKEAEGLEKALEVEDDADRKLKELASVIKRSEQRDLPAVEGFGVAIRGRRLVLKRALAPGEVEKLAEESKPEKGKASKERSAWMHLLHVGEINDTHEGWAKLSKSEKRQRQESMKERKWRINNSNFAIHPQRLSVRNLPRHVDATKLREILVHHLAGHSSLVGEVGKKERLKKAQALLQQVKLVRDQERKTESNERRSKGFGFMSFKDHRSAMTALQHLNDNPDIFGGGKRPIVEFAIEDKRKLRMQEELYAKHAHKLLGKDATKGKGKGGKGADGDCKGKGRGSGENPVGSDRILKKKNKKKEGMSRGQRQREKRRQQKALAEEKAQKKAIHDAKMDKIKERKSKEAIDKQIAARKRSKRFEPDARQPSKKSRTQDGHLSDDFELRAMERFRSGRK